MEWLRKTAASIAALSKEAWAIFWGIDKDDQIKEVAGKMAKTISKGAFYSLSDNLLSALSAATVVFLTWLGWGEMEIIVAMWIEDVIVAYGFVIFSQSAVEDFTLTEAIRASIDSIRRNKIGRIVANLLTFGILIRFSIWDGPERVAIFFHKELPKNFQKLFVVMAFSVIQAVAWTKFYSLGINGLADIWNLFF